MRDNKSFTQRLLDESSDICLGFGALLFLGGLIFALSGELANLIWLVLVLVIGLICWASTNNDKKEKDTEKTKYNPFKQPNNFSHDSALEWKKCPNCEHKVNNVAKKCPYCDYKFK